jgi:RNA polymerase sigma-70 factor (ECF subfamily)
VSSPPLSREQLAAVRGRDPRALGAFYERHVDGVFALAYRLLGERAAAEDVTSEVFFKVHRAAHTIDPERDPLPWLKTITYNACRDVWRSGAYRLGRKSRSIDDDPLVADRLVTSGDDPQRAFERGERERIVQEALLELPEHLRAAIVLYDYEGLSHSEIAEMFGVNHAAARKRYSRALAALGRILEGRLR